MAVPRRRGWKAGRGRAAGRVSAANWGNFWGGGGNNFFRAEISTKERILPNLPLGDLQEAKNNFINELVQGGQGQHSAYGPTEMECKNILFL